jgi:hypothetical protein
MYIESFISSNDCISSPFQQNPVCEGNGVRSKLFDIKSVQLDRPAFNVVTDGNALMVDAGEMLGIKPGTELAIYTSETEATSLLKSSVDQFRVVVDQVGSTTCRCSFKGAAARDHALEAAVASPTSPSQEPFFVVVASSAPLAVVEEAIDKENRADQLGRPRILIANAPDGADYIQIVAEKGGSLGFLHRSSSDVARYGVDHLIYTAPPDPPIVRSVLRAAAHFFKFLRVEPSYTSFRLRDFVETRIYDLEEQGFNILDGRVTRALNPKRRLELDTSDAYEVQAAQADEAPNKAVRYGIELAKKEELGGLFVWAFFFDCSTLEISAYRAPVS